jgi:hypothetical protein
VAQSHGDRRHKRDAERGGLLYPAMATTGDDDECLGISALVPVRPIYPSVTWERRSKVYSGPIAVDSVAPCKDRIFADLAGDLQVR